MSKDQQLVLSQASLALEQALGLILHGLRRSA
jgi:hypothetical protein